METWAIATMSGWFTAVSAITVAVIQRNGRGNSSGITMKDVRTAIDAGMDRHTLDCSNAKTFAESAKELRESIGTLNERIDRLLERGH